MMGIVRCAVSWALRRLTPSSTAERKREQRGDWGSRLWLLPDRIRSNNDENLQLIEMDVVGRPIEAFEMVVPFQLVSGTCGGK